MTEYMCDRCGKRPPTTLARYESGVWLCRRCGEIELAELRAATDEAVRALVRRGRRGRRPLITPKGERGD